MHPSHVCLTKITAPTRRPHLLRRRRLLDFLEQHIDRKAILIAAPAGYGKTSLLLDWAHETVLPLGWYSLAPTDSDPKVFCEYLLAALDRLFPEQFPQTAAHLAAAQFPRDLQTLCATLVNEIQTIPTYFALVLDDWHCVDSSEWVNAFLDVLLGCLPENAHFILASRRTPTRLALPRLNARQELATLCAPDLKFSAAELLALVRQNHWPRLAPADAQALVDFAEGWIAGILLMRPETPESPSKTRGLVPRGDPGGTEMAPLLTSLRPSARPVASRGTLDHRPRGFERGGELQVFDYFACEVFARQTPERQQFLLQSSILDELSLSIVRALWGPDGARQLAALEKRSLFLTRVDEGTETTWRYHVLFRQFLVMRFRETAPAEEREWHARAARFFETQAHWRGAIAHYRQASRVEEAARLIDQQAEEQMRRGHYETVAQWIDDLPPTLPEQFPNLLLRRGLIYHRVGEHVLGDACLTRAEQSYRARGDAPGQVTVAIERSACLQQAGYYTASLEVLRAALALVPRDMATSQARLRELLGTGLCRLGDWESGLTELAAGLGGQLAAGTPVATVARRHHELGVTLWGLRNPDSTWQPPRGATQVALAEWECRSGASATAEARLVAARQQAQQTGVPSDALSVKMAASLVLRAQGDLAGSDRELGEALTLAQEIQSRTVQLRTELHMALNDWLGARPDSFRAHMEAVAGLARELDETQVILADAELVFPAIATAIDWGIEASFYRRLRSQMNWPMSQCAQARVEPVPRVAVEVAEPKVRVQAFGNSAIWVDGRKISLSDWEAMIARELFFLVLYVPDGLRKDELLEHLWPDLSPAQARENLYRTGSRVRKVIPRQYFIREGERYLVRRAAGLNYDVDDFERLLGEAEDVRAPYTQAEKLRAAIALYRGDYFVECYRDWAAPLRRRLEGSFHRALLSLARLEENLGRDEPALAAYTRLLAGDGSNGIVVQSVMRLRSKLGDRVGALTCYRQHAERIHEEHGVAPDPETEALYRGIAQV